MAGLLMPGGLAAEFASRSGPEGKHPSAPLLEFAVQDAAGARIAAEVGASRVELCAALGSTGGLTPSIGAVSQSVETGIPVHVLVRPRAGGFVYSDEECSLIEADVRAALRAGASGVVVGALTPGGKIDARALVRFVAAAREEAPDRDVTFHRALDTALAAGVPVEDLLATLSDLGVDRVLTSGGALDCRAGLPVLRALVQASRAMDLPVQIMAGGGVRVRDLEDLALSGVDAIHLSARRGPAADRDGRPGQASVAYEHTDASLASEVASRLRELAAR